MAVIIFPVHADATGAMCAGRSFHLIQSIHIWSLPMEVIGHMCEFIKFIISVCYWVEHGVFLFR